jgi:hypothetical protein
VPLVPLIYGFTYAHVSARDTTTTSVLSVDQPGSCLRKTVIRRPVVLPIKGSGFSGTSGTARQIRGLIREKTCTTTMWASGTGEKESPSDPGVFPGQRGIHCCTTSSGTARGQGSLTTAGCGFVTMSCTPVAMPMAMKMPATIATTMAVRLTKALTASPFPQLDAPRPQLSYALASSQMEYQQLLGRGTWSPLG